MGPTGARLGARRVVNCCNVCRIAGAGKKRVRARTLASLAILAMANVGHSSTPRPIYARNRQLHPRGSIRASPIEGSGAHRRGDRPD